MNQRGEEADSLILVSAWELNAFVAQALALCALCALWGLLGRWLLRGLGIDLTIVLPAMLLLIGLGFYPALRVHARATRSGKLAFGRYLAGAVAAGAVGAAVLALFGG